MLTVLNADDTNNSETHANRNPWDNGGRLCTLSLPPVDTWQTNPKMRRHLPFRVVGDFLYSISSEISPHVGVHNIINLANAPDRRHFRTDTRGHC